MAKDSMGKTFGVAAALCIVCSLFVSFAAVSLKPIQEKNKAIEKKKNILLAAGLYSDGDDIEAIYADKITEKVVNLASGDYNSEIDVKTFDQRKAAKDSEMGILIPSKLDIGKIKRRSKNSVVYQVKSAGGQVEQIILPVHGKGLWSTMYGFLALKPDLNTVVGLGFYEHAETPGLGGEIDNPRWKSIWVGKQIFGSDSSIKIAVIKGRVDNNRPGSKHQVDGLSGATLTSRGVSDTVRYWVGDHGFGPFIAKLKQGGAL